MFNRASKPINYLVLKWPRSLAIFETVFHLMKGMRSVDMYGKEKKSLLFIE